MDSKMRKIVCLFLCLKLFDLSLGAVPLNEFFPFGASTLDLKLARTNGEVAGPIQLQIPFSYFNNSYTNVFVSNNGAIMFRTRIFFSTFCGSISRDSVMLTPFWANVNLEDGGDVFYRESREGPLLEKANRDIRKAFPELWWLKIGSVFIATWDRVPRDRGYSNCNPSLDLRNTFQAILATDGTQSFVLFYYNAIEWTTDIPEAKGNCNGVGGIPAKAGFDEGNGRSFYELPGSCTAEVSKIVSGSNIGEPGKWIFRVDNSYQTAACDDQKFKTEKLKIYPSITSTFGHIPIILKGPCLNGAVTAICQFHDPGQAAVTVPGILDIEESTVTCTVPFLYSYGRIPVSLTIVKVGPGRTEREETFSGFIYSTEPSNPKLEVIYKNNERPRGQSSEDEVQLDAHQLHVKWDPSVFPNISQDLDLELTLLEFDSIWAEGELLARGIYNNGEYVLDLATMPKTESNSTKLFGAYALAAYPIPTYDNERRRRKRGFQNWVGEWIISPFTYSKSKDNSFYKAKCESWHAAEPAPPSDILNCPPTLEQAENDQRFEKDTAANWLFLDFFHPTGDTSFRQMVPSPSGAGQQCVYKDERIFVNAPGGGTADRISPNLSKERHFQEDVIPFYDCCIYSGEGEGYCQKYYYSKRPSDGGEDYLAPRRARAVGDPHITTFDLTSYTFNGVGEFWMIKSPDFRMQARMEPFNGVSKASIFTAFVMDDGASHVQVQVVMGLAQGIDVLLNKEIITVEKNESQRSFTLRSSSVTITFGSPLTVTFTSGFSFAFSRAENSLSLISTAEQVSGGAGASAKGWNTSGLLGVFDGNPDNDLRNPDGKIFTASSSNLKEIHYEFGLKWMISEQESLFVYSGLNNYADYADPKFVPTFELIDPNNVPSTVKDLCKGSIECIFDYQVTGSLTFANETKSQVEIFDESVVIMNQVVGMCEPIEHFENGYIRVDNWFHGSTATFTCHEGYVLQNGHENVTCSKRSETDDGATEKFVWDREVFPICVLQNSATSVKTLPLLLLIFSIILPFSKL